MRHHAIQTAATMGALALFVATAAHAGARQADFNGDGRADLAIGVPFESVAGEETAGAVAVIYGRPIRLNQAGDQFWTADSPGINRQAESQAGFGRALAAGDFDGDGFTDLAIGSPGADAVAKDDDAGAVNIIYGSAAGLAATNDQRFTRDTPGILGEPIFSADFGTTLVAGDFNGDGRDDLAIGVPEQPIGAARNAGEVHILYGSASGLAVAGNHFFNQDTPGIEDQAQQNDFFGASLTVGDFNGDGFAELVIGALGERLNGVSEAGVTHVLYGSSDGLTVDGAQFLAQGIDGVEDTPEPEDEFGFTFAAGDFDHDGRDDLAVAAVGESISGQTFAGAVHVLYGTDDGLNTSNDQFWHQDSPNIKGEPGFDLFGAGLAVGDFDRDQFDDLAIGSPFDTAGLVESAGALNVLYGTAHGLRAAGNQLWHQDSPGILDDAEIGDFFGFPLTAGDYDNDGFDDLAIGAAQEVINNIAGGAVNVIYGTANGLKQIGNQLWHQDSQGIADTAEDDDNFGRTLR
jgi:hypothetical protein